MRKTVGNAEDFGFPAVFCHRKHRVVLKRESI